MNMLILDEEQRTAVQALNASSPGYRELAPVQLDDGRWALNADLLQDCAPGHTWEHYSAALGALPIEEVISLRETSV